MPSSATDDDMLFVAGSCISVSVHPLLDHVALLTIPAAVAIDRPPIGRPMPTERTQPSCARLQLRTVVEPLLRGSACLEIDTSRQPVADVIAMIMKHVVDGH
jgi:hypothetical protein